MNNVGIKKEKKKPLSIEEGEKKEHVKKFCQTNKEKKTKQKSP